MALKVEWFGGYGGRGCPIPDLQGARVVARSRTTITESGTLELPGGIVTVHRKVYFYRGIGPLLSAMFRTPVGRTNSNSTSSFYSFRQNISSITTGWKIINMLAINLKFSILRD